MLLVQSFVFYEYSTFPTLEVDYPICNLLLRSKLDRESTAYIVFLLFLRKDGVDLKVKFPIQMFSFSNQYQTVNVAFATSLTYYTWCWDRQAEPHGTARGCLGIKMTMAT